MLNPRVKDLEKREQYLSQRIKGMESNAERAERTLTSLSKERQRLQDIGLPLEALAQFSERVQSIAQRHSITPAKLRDRLLQELESLNQGLGLEALVQSRQLELDERERTIARAKEELETIKSVVSGLKQEKSSLEAGIRETRERVSREIAKIPPAARLAINQLMEELRRGNDEALAEAHRLGDKALEVGRQLGQYEAILRDTEWLNQLLALTRGEVNLEGKQVRVVVLSVVRGTAIWLKEHQAESPGFHTLLPAVENLIRELEQWKI
jgi:chromosome segregation ATPase